MPEHSGAAGVMREVPMLDDATWAAASPAERAAAFGLDLDLLASRAARFRRAVGRIALPAAAGLAILAMALQTLGRPAEGEPVFIAELFGWFLLGVALGFAAHAVALAAFGVIARGDGGLRSRWADRVATVVFDATWIMSAFLVGTLDRPAAVWLLPPGVVAAALLFSVHRLDLPLGLLRDGSSSAREGWHRIAAMDPRSTGVGPTGWLFAEAIFASIGAAAAAMLVIHHASPLVAAVVLAALVAVDMVDLSLRRRSYPAGVAASGLAAAVGVLLVATTT